MQMTKLNRNRVVITRLAHDRDKDKKYPILFPRVSYNCNDRYLVHNMHHIAICQNQRSFKLDADTLTTRPQIWPTKLKSVDLIFVSLWQNTRILWNN